MKNYRINSVQPTSNQLHTFLNGRLSDVGKRSAAFYAVCHLFVSSEALYRTLNTYTSESLAVFTDAKRYLTTQQEHDLMALTAQYATAINTQWLERIVKQDPTIDENDRSLLQGALDLYKTTTGATSSALGSPRWLE